MNIKISLSHSETVVSKTLVVLRPILKPYEISSKFSKEIKNHLNFT